MWDFVQVEKLVLRIWLGPAFFAFYLISHKSWYIEHPPIRELIPTIFMHEFWLIVLSDEKGVLNFKWAGNRLQTFTDFAADRLNMGRFLSTLVHWNVEYKHVTPSLRMSSQYKQVSSYNEMATGSSFTVNFVAEEGRQYWSVFEGERLESWLYNLLAPLCEITWLLLYHIQQDSASDLSASYATIGKYIS